MLEIESKIAELADDYRRAPESPVSYDFNILEETHAGENAHTRILVRLLRHPQIARSFLEFLAKGFDRPQLKPAADVVPQVDCFSEYVDARIRFGDQVIIIENKIRDAVDQDAQLDRYVLGELNKGIRPQNVFVVYLTKNGQKKVSEASLSEARDILGFVDENHSGHFLAVNYRDHIIPWLQSSLRFSLVEEQREHFLISGIMQYVHYLEGPEVLDVRKPGDSRADKRGALSRCLEAMTADEIVQLSTTVKWLQLQRICATVLTCDPQRFDALVESERREVIKRLFAGIEGRVLPDDELYCKFDLNPSPDGAPSCGVFAINRWVDTSLLQVDVWHEEGTDADAYRRWHEAAVGPHLEDSGIHAYGYEYNGCPATRFNVNDLDEMVKVLRVLRREMTDRPGEAPKQNLVTERLAQVCDPVFCADLTRTLRQKVSDTLADKLAGIRWGALTCSFGTIDYTYSWHHGWAIQLNENFLDNGFVRAVDFFPARGFGLTVQMMHELFSLSADYPYCCYRWNGRVVFRFPVTDLQSGVKLCERLNALRMQS